MSIKASLKATKSMTGTAATAMGLMTKASYIKMYGDDAEYVASMDVVQSINSVLCLIGDIRKGKTKKQMINNQLAICGMVLAHNVCFIPKVNKFVKRVVGINTISRDDRTLLNLINSQEILGYYSKIRREGNVYHLTSISGREHTFEYTVDETVVTGKVIDSNGDTVVTMQSDELDVWLYCRERNI